MATKPIIQIEENEDELDVGQILKERLKRYDNLNFFEHYAMYMGKVQLLEIGLKKLLFELYQYEFDMMEKWTLGRVKNELKNSGLRPDFIQLLESVVTARNYIAHDILADDAIMHSLINEGYFTKNERILMKAIFELEQIIIIFDWTNENDGWGLDANSE